MNCPKCDSPNNKVTDSREFISDEIEGIRRRRVCQKCKHRFSTLETIYEFDGPQVRIQKARANGVKKQPPPPSKPDMSQYEKLRQKILSNSGKG